MSPSTRSGRRPRPACRAPRARSPDTARSRSPPVGRGCPELVLLDDGIEAALRHVFLELLVDRGVEVGILVRLEELLPRGVRVLLERRRALALPRREVGREEQRAHVQPILEV